jgi:hypothetical protein
MAAGVEALSIALQLLCGLPAGGRYFGGVGGQAGANSAAAGLNALTQTLHVGLTVHAHLLVHLLHHTALLLTGRRQLSLVLLHALGHAEASGPITEPSAILCAGILSMGAGRHAEQQ